MWESGLSRGFPAGSVAKNLPGDTGGRGTIPGPGRLLHVAMQLSLRTTTTSLGSAAREVNARSPYSKAREHPGLAATRDKPARKEDRHSHKQRHIIEASSHRLHCIVLELKSTASSLFLTTPTHRGDHTFLSRYWDFSSWRQKRLSLPVAASLSVYSVGRLRAVLASGAGLSRLTIRESPRPSVGGVHVGATHHVLSVSLTSIKKEKRKWNLNILHC